MATPESRLAPLLAMALVAGCQQRSCSGDRDTAEPILPRAAWSVEGGPGEGKPEHVGAYQGMQVRLLVLRPEGPARQADATIAFDEQASLGVAVSEKGQWYADLPELSIDGERIGKPDIRPLAELPGFVRVWWFKVEAEKGSYRNTDRNEGWWADIRYVQTLDHIGPEGARPVDVGPLGQEGVSWEGTPVGTMRYKASVELVDTFLSTPGPEQVQNGGALPGVLRVSRKGGSGDRIVDHGLSLVNLPYIWGSAAIDGKGRPESHQSEMYIGSDCADLVVASWRLSGASDFGYSGVVPMIRELSSSPYGARIAGEREGVLFDEAQRPIVLGESGVRIGAGVMWRFGPGLRKGHAALLLSDSGPGGRPDGLLGLDDPVLSTMWDTPEVEPLGEVLTSLLPVAVLNPPGIVTGERSIEVDLDGQELWAIEDGKIVHAFDISSGRDGSTPVGSFRIWRKSRLKDMKVGLVVLGKYFVLRDVPSIMYFAGEGLPRERGFAIHGTYWHDDFGKPVSHGCINLAGSDAGILFSWAGPVTGADDDVVATAGNPGTPVLIHGTPP